MDSLTQLVYGAVIGQAGFQQRLGRKSVAWGAVAGTLPDLDVIANIVVGPLAEHSFHRGPTHSFLFAGIGGLLGGIAVASWYRRRSRSRTEPMPGGRPGDWVVWSGLFVLVFATHALLDAFTGYGTQLWLPFSNKRVAWHGLSIIDPAFTLPLIAALLYGLIKGFGRPRAMTAALVALAMVTAYQVVTVRWQDRAMARVVAHLEQSGIEAERVFVTPMPPTSLLRRAVVLTEDEVRTGFFSLASASDMGQWTVAPRDRSPEVAALMASAEGRVFDWFAAGIVAGRVTEDGGGQRRVQIDDLRFGVPGTAANTGLWGIEAPIEVTGDEVEIGPVGRFEREPSFGPEAISWLWGALGSGFAQAGEPPVGR